MPANIMKFTHSVPAGQQLDGTPGKGEFVELDAQETGCIVSQIAVAVGTGAATTVNIYLRQYGVTPDIPIVKQALLSTEEAYFLSDVKLMIGPKDRIVIETTGCINRVYATIYVNSKA